MDNTTQAPTWNDTTRKSAVGVTRAHVVLVAAPLFLYVNAYDVIRLLLLDESAAILASLADGMLALAAFFVLFIALAPVLVGIWARKRTVAQYLAELSIYDRFVATPLTASVSGSVFAFLAYGGVTGLLLLLAGNQSYGLMDFTVLLAALPISAALSYPISLFATRSVSRQVEFLAAQA